MAKTREVLATTTAALVTRDANSKGFELLNLGPNNLWAALGAVADCVVNKCRKIAPGDFWACGDSSGTLYIKCETADQVTGAATILTEVA